MLLGLGVEKFVENIGDGGVDGGNFRALIFKSVSKKTTHAGCGAREAFPRFFLPPYSVKFIFFGV